MLSENKKCTILLSFQPVPEQMSSYLDYSAQFATGSELAQSQISVGEHLEIQLWGKKNLIINKDIVFVKKDWEDFC